MRQFGQAMAAGGGYGGDHKTPLPTLKFKERPPAPPSPTQLRFPSEIPATRIRYSDKKGGTRTRKDDWTNPLALSSERIDTIVHMYDELKMSAKAVGEKVGVSHTTVLRHLRDRDVEIRGSIKGIDMERVHMHLRNGKSIRTVAKIMNVSASTLVRHIENEYKENWR